MTHAISPLALPVRVASGAAGVVAVPPRPPRLPPPAGPTGAAALREQLRAAERAVRAGQMETARWLCAGAILRHQPLLVGSVPLLRQTIAALLASGAFGQLARLLAAVRGRTVQVRPGLAAARALAAPADAPTAYALDPAWFAGPGAERVVQHWAAVLARASRTAAPGHKVGAAADRA